MLKRVEHIVKDFIPRYRHLFDISMLLLAQLCGLVRGTK